MSSRSRHQCAILRVDGRDAARKPHTGRVPAQTTPLNAGLITPSGASQDQPVSCQSRSVYVVRVLAWHTDDVSTYPRCDPSACAVPGRPHVVRDMSLWTT